VKVSVCIIAFNVEAFIAQAIEGALAQRTNFDFEVVIGEDCSQDSTKEIIADYHRRFPKLIRAIFRENRLGMVRNFAETVLACKGQYIAMLDGDDFWNSPDKLQKQADLLDDHPECSGCYHNVNLLNEDDPQGNRPKHSKGQKAFLGLHELAAGNPVCAGSMLFRAGLFNEFPGWYFKMPMQDWPLYVLNAHFGPVAYIDEILSTYRIHRNGDWSRQDRVDVLKRDISAAQTMNRGLNYSLDKQIGKAIANSQYKISKILLSQKDREGARSYSREAMKQLTGIRYLKALWVYLHSGCFW
jgi:glycosyltransferase involved in cell wall biosynthesis